MVRHTHDYFVHELLPEGICWMHRNDVPYRDLTEVSRMYYELFALTEPWRLELSGTSRPAPIGWLFDVRNGPVGRSDAPFEAIHQRFRQVMLRHQSKLVVLCKTASGVMQLTRMSREDGNSFESTRDEAEALAMLRAHLRRTRANAS